MPRALVGPGAKERQLMALHDRRMPRSRANIDHIAIAPSGVYVIDTKRYHGKVEVVRPWFGEPLAAARAREVHDGLARGLR